MPNDCKGLSEAASSPLPKSLYRFVWEASREQQIRLCLITGALAPLGLLPLEMQRRIVDIAVSQKDLHLLYGYGSLYLASLLLYGGIKYLLNLQKGSVLEGVTRNLRHRILTRLAANSGPEPVGNDTIARFRGTIVSVLAAEAEDLGNFASECLSLPMLQGGTIVWTLGYLLWVQPEVTIIAALVYLPQVILVPKVQAAINRLSRRRTVLMRTMEQSVVDAGGHHKVVNRPRRHAHARVITDLVFRTRMNIYRKKYFLTFLGNLLDSLGPLSILMVGGYLVIKGQAEMGTLVVFISGFHRIAEPWDLLVNFYRSVSNMRVAYDLVRRAVQH